MKNNRWELVGKIGVDAGLCWIGDPCYCVTPDVDEHPAKTWQEFCNLLGGQDVKQFNYRAGHPGLGVCVRTGGDGWFPVFVKRNAHGEIAEVNVKFE
jgi:hypothetical protein